MNTRLNSPFNVDIRAICFISASKIAVSNADGQIFLYDFSSKPPSLSHHQVLPKRLWSLHFPVPIGTVALFILTFLVSLNVTILRKEEVAGVSSLKRAASNSSNYSVTIQSFLPSQRSFPSASSISPLAPSFTKFTWNTFPVRFKWLISPGSPPWRNNTKIPRMKKFGKECPEFPIKSAPKPNKPFL